MTKLTPAEIAEYDQALSWSASSLAALVQSYLVQREVDELQDVPEECTVVGLSQCLADEWQHDQVASVLAAAVYLLAGWPS